ncbi:MAG: ABC transporter permease [Gemmatimonadales bacterium]
MIGWVLRRTAAAVALVVLGTIVLVVLVHLLPGDPLTAIIGDRAIDPAARDALAARWGIGRPLPTVVADFLRNALHGDLGTSLAEQRPVATILRERLGPTTLLGGTTLLVNFTVGLFLGTWSALHPESRRARAIGAISLATYTIPAFVIGLGLVWLGAIALPWFPAGGASDPLLDPEAGLAAVLLDRAHHLALPLLTMVLATIAVPIRQQRSAALETAHAAWVVAARARGVAPRRVAWQHVWRPALSPVITLLGLWLPMLVSGAVFVEAVFAWPGIGSLLATATAQRDIPLVIGTGVVVILLVQVGSLLADILQRLLDPVQRTA